MNAQEIKTADTHKKLPFVKVYHGYGHSGNVIIYGHVFRKEPRLFKEKANGFSSNLVQLFKLFRVRTIPGAVVEVWLDGQQIRGATEYDGFFRIEIIPRHQLKAGWHEVAVNYLDGSGQVLAASPGAVFVPHVSQYAFISDVDDTIMQSFSATIFKRLYELLSRNPQKRRLFKETAKHYNLLAYAHAENDVPNPFFYVSSSEWNLYDYLRQVFLHNRLPDGIFLLNQIKRWYELFRSGRTVHEGKLIRIARIFKAFPRQQFVLLGDNSQKDPQIYQAIAEKHPDQVFAVYIRKVRRSKEAVTRAVLSGLQAKGIHTCLFEHSEEAISHGISCGLIKQNST